MPKLTLLEKAQAKLEAQKKGLTEIIIDPDGESVFSSSPPMAPKPENLSPPPKVVIKKPEKVDAIPEADLGRIEIDFDKILNAWINDLDTRRSFMKIFKSVLPTAFKGIDTRQTKKGMTQDFNVSATKYLRGTSKDNKALINELKKGVKLQPKGSYKYKEFILEEQDKPKTK